MKIDFVGNASLFKETNDEEGVSSEIYGFGALEMGKNNDLDLEKNNIKELATKLVGQIRDARSKNKKKQPDNQNKADIAKE